jgi:alpha-beta hydrolase superfamily lysophospholipase
METQKMHIGTIPAIVYGPHSEKAFIFVHGRYSRKEDAAGFAEKAVARGFQVLAFDLPEHGDRSGDPETCSVQNGVHDLGAVLGFAKDHWKKLALAAFSLGAYFSLAAYREEHFEKCLFMSPVLDMERLIRNMMLWSNVSESELETKKEIPTTFGEKLIWDYFQYVKAHPVDQWRSPTAILYGSRDNLTDRDVLDSFAERFGAESTIIEGGEHYFQKPEEIAALDKWIEDNIPE